MTTKNILIGVGAVIVAVAIWGGYNYPSVTEYSTTHEVTNNVGSPTGSTFNTAKTAMIVWSPASAAATTTSILNSDSSDRIVKQAQYYCSGLAAVTSPLASTGWIFQMATTSVANEGLQANTNYLLNQSVPTTTAQLFVGSTTPGLTGTSINRVWPAGTYLTVLANSVAPASCVIGVDYVAS